MLTYDLSRRGDESLYEYIYLCIRADIENGVIPAGRRLPSKRALAKNLGVSLITVEGAYSQLVAEGYVRAEPRRGYFACELAPRPAGVAAARREPAGGRHAATGLAAPALDSRRAADSAAAGLDASRYRPSPVPAGRPAGAAQALGWSVPGVSAAQSPAVVGRLAATASQPPAPLVADFSGGSLPLSRFPFPSWAKTVREVLSRESEQALLGDACAQGTLALRTELAEHLRSLRGMRVDPSQVVIAAGSQVLYNLIVQFLGRDLTYAVETPGYPRLTSIYRANGVRLAHVPLDAGGIDVAELRRARADVAHIMPSHQFPTGRVTSVSRRYELLGWASERPGRFIVEDDYDCEFRLSGRPIPSLFSVDATSCVIYTNTFAKSLGASFRIAYMVLPEPLVGPYQERLGFYSSTVSATEQLALARFMSSGEYERHVSRTRTYYRALKNDLVEALSTCPVTDLLTVEGAEAGLHFLMRVDASVPQARLLEAARARGVVLSPLSQYCAEGDVGEDGVAFAEGPRAQDARGSRETPHECATSAFAEGPQAQAPRGSRKTPHEGTYVMSYAGLLPEQVGPAVDALTRAVQDALRD